MRNKSGVLIRQELLRYISDANKFKFGTNVIENIIDLYPLTIITMPETQNHNINNWNVSSTPRTYAVQKDKEGLDKDYSVFLNNQEITVPRSNDEIDENLIAVKDAEYVYLINII